MVFAIQGSLQSCWRNSGRCSVTVTCPFWSRSREIAPCFQKERCWWETCSLLLDKDTSSGIEHHSGLAVRPTGWMGAGLCQSDKQKDVAARSGFVPHVISSTRGSQPSLRYEEFGTGVMRPSVALQTCSSDGIFAPTWLRCNPRRKQKGRFYSVKKLFGFYIGRTQSGAGGIWPTSIRHLLPFGCKFPQGWLCALCSGWVIVQNTNSAASFLLISYLSHPYYLMKQIRKPWHEKSFINFCYCINLISMRVETIG